MFSPFAFLYPYLFSLHKLHYAVTQLNLISLFFTGSLLLIQHVLLSGFLLHCRQLVQKYSVTAVVMVLSNN